MNLVGITCIPGSSYLLRLFVVRGTWYVVHGMGYVVRGTWSAAVWNVCLSLCISLSFPGADECVVVHVLRVSCFSVSLPRYGSASILDTDSTCKLETRESKKVTEAEEAALTVASTGAAVAGRTAALCGKGATASFVSCMILSGNLMQPSGKGRGVVSFANLVIVGKLGQPCDLLLSCEMTAGTDPPAPLLVPGVISECSRGEIRVEGTACGDQVGAKFGDQCYRCPVGQYVTGCR